MFSRPARISFVLVSITVTMILASCSNSGSRQKLGKLCAASDKHPFEKNSDTEVLNVAPADKATLSPGAYELVISKVFVFNPKSHLKFMSENKLDENKTMVSNRECARGFRPQSDPFSFQIVTPTELSLAVGRTLNNSKKLSKPNQVGLMEAATATSILGYQLSFDGRKVDDHLDTERSEAMSFAQAFEASESTTVAEIRTKADNKKYIEIRSLYVDSNATELHVWSRYKLTTPSLPSKQKN